MVRLAGTLSHLETCKVMVVGDLILDAYTHGKVNRISPEAPVPVVHVQREDRRAGGSGNVVLNLQALGAEVVTVGRVGQDDAGRALRDALERGKQTVSGIVVQRDFPTPLKNRVIANNQQIVRVDHERSSPLPREVERRLLSAMPDLLEGIQVIAVSDYGKGFVTPSLLQSIIKLARDRGIPVISDPKGLDFSKYVGSTILKPNLSEALAAAGLGSGDDLEQAAAILLEKYPVDTLMVTRSGEGISLFFPSGQSWNFPVKVREVVDVTGAGDTVLAMIACCVANGLTLAEATQMANVAAGIAIESVGCGLVTIGQLARRLLDYDSENKVFDEEHLFVLKEALEEKKTVCLAIGNEAGLTPELYEAIATLSQQPDTDLVLCVREGETVHPLLPVLSGLSKVKFIVSQKESLDRLCAVIQPDEVFTFHEGSVHRADLVSSMDTVSI